MQKTPEDEAFDELERRQGGFRAKRAMAAKKLQEDQVKYGASWSKDGERIDPMSVYNEPAQEPAFGWIKQSELAQARLYGGSVNLWLEKHDCDFPLYTAPPQRPWVGLTDEQRLMALKFIDPKTARLPPGFKQFAEAIEKLLKDQNV